MRQLRWTTLVVLLVAVASGSAAAAQPHIKKPRKVAVAKTAPLQLVGDSDNRGMYDSPDPNQPATVAQQIKGLGMNTERLYINWDPTRPLPSHDQLRQLCNAATQAVLSGITNLIVALPPLPNQQPMDDQHREPYYEAWKAYFADLFDPARGCVSGNYHVNGVMVPKLQRLFVEPLNESNIDTFCRPQTDTTHDLCADLAVQMRAYIYPLLKDLGQQYGVQVIVIGGALSSHHDPAGFIQAECTAMQRHGITSANMDAYGFHPYQLRGSQNFLSGFLLFAKIQPLIHKCYGDLPFIYDEVGLETIVPGNLGYTCQNPDNPCNNAPGSSIFTDAQRAYNYQVMLALARKQGAIGVVFFLLNDQQDLAAWQSGLYYWNGTPKPFLPDIAQAVTKALS